MVEGERMDGCAGSDKREANGMKLQTKIFF
jgi:hypothetical protein